MLELEIREQILNIIDDRIHEHLSWIDYCSKRLKSEIDRETIEDLKCILDIESKKKIELEYLKTRIMMEEP